MKQFEYDRQYDNFDSYKRFSNNRVYGFTEFLNGELMYTRSQPDPDERKMYEKYGIQIACTNDTGLPSFTTMKGEEVPKSWLHYRGTQYLVIDHDKGVALGTGNWSEFDRLQLPLNLSGHARVYWASHRAMPVGGRLRYWKPAELTEQEHDYVAILKKLAKALCALEGDMSGNVSSIPVWSTSQLRQFMTANPDPSSAMQQLPAAVARQMVYVPTNWLERDEVTAQYLTWYGSVRSQK